jgi:hypothetical protein
MKNSVFFVNIRLIVKRLIAERMSLVPWLRRHTQSG